MEIMELESEIEIRQATHRRSATTTAGESCVDCSGSESLNVRSSETQASG